jgi:hypothetical protein
MRAARKYGAVLAASLVGAVVLAEGGLRVFGAFEPPPAVPQPMRPDLNQAHPELGYTLRPSTRVDYTYPVGSGNVITLSSNSDGFRNDREFDEADPRPRIWVLGDSMVLGEGVHAHERLTAVIERVQPAWRVDNLGMTGWGLDLMVRAYEHISRRVTPDVVVLAFYTDDFRRLRPLYSGMGYPFPKFELVDGALVTVPFPDPLPAWRRLRVVQALEQTYWRFARNRFTLNGALLDRLRGDIKPPTKLAVVFVPGQGDTPEDQTRRKFLLEWCQRTTTPFLDLTDTMRKAGVDSLHIPENYHWNSRGHEVAGTAIQAFLREAGVVPIRQGTR